MVRAAVVYDNPTGKMDAVTIKKNRYGPTQANLTYRAVVKALKDRGYEVVGLPATSDLVRELERPRVDVVFNLATGVSQKAKQAHIVALLEMSGKPFTGSGMGAQVLGIRKDLAKQLFLARGINTPAFTVWQRPKGDRGGLSFPLIVKPVGEGSSMGIWADSIVRDDRALRAAVARVMDTFHEPVLIEEYIQGREFTIGVLGDDCLPIEEIIFPGEIYEYPVKERDAVQTICPARIPEDLAAEMRNMALEAFRAIGCEGYARVDLRVDKEGRPFILEINTLPGLQPGYSEFPRMAEAAGMSYADLVERILNLALRRAEYRAAN